MNLFPGVAAAESEADRLGSWEVFDVTRNDGTHFPHGGVGMRGRGETADQRHVEGYEGGKAGGIGGDGLTSREKFGVIVEDGGVVERATGIHDGMRAGGADAGDAVVGGEEIAAGDDGDGKAADKFGQGAGIGNAAETLPGGTGMQGDPARAEILQTEGKVMADAVGVVKAKAEFEANVPGSGGGDEGAGNVEGVGGVAKHGRPRSLFENLGYGAAHVEIEPAVTGIAQEGGGAPHKRCLRPEKLDDERTIAGQRAEKIAGSRAAIDEAFGADHFRDAHGRAVAAAEQAEGEIAVARQRRKPGRVGREGQGGGHGAGAAGQGGGSACGGHGSGFPEAAVAVGVEEVRKGQRSGWRELRCRRERAKSRAS